MFLSFLLSGFLALNPFAAPLRGPLAAPAVAPAMAGSIDPCRIYGSVYLERDPSRRNYCFASVYLEPESAFCDLLVYSETNKLFADRAGLWYPTEARSFADYALFVTDNRNLADFSFQYTKVRNYAGCQKQ